MIDPKEVERVERLLNRLGPRIQKWLTAMMEKEGHTVTLSIAANVGTSLMSTCMMLVAQKGGDVEGFLNILMQEAGGKYIGALSEVKAQRAAVMAEMAQNGWDTCRPLH